MTMKSITICLLTALALPSTLVAAPKDQTKNEKAKAKNPIAGTYEVISGERNGKALKKEEITETTVLIGDDALTSFDKDRKKVYAASYTLDKSTKPWTITMTSELTPRKDNEQIKTIGLVQKKGKRLKLIYAFPGGKAPTDFKTDPRQQMFVLKRVSEKKSAK